MKVLSCHLENFASYKELDFTFDDKGLALIQGATGSGKSTLCDVIPWILFGRTAKNGSVDEILSWPGDQVTTGSIVITPIGDQRGATVTIVRKRGPKAKDNDLYWFYTGARSLEVTRGKDLQDTQKLINNLLGLNIDLYLSGAYYHEFSQTAQFFTTTAKNRRSICEQVVDLSMAKNLQDKATIELKSIQPGIDNHNTEVYRLETRIKYVIDSLNKAEINYQNWDKNQANKIAAIEAQALSFEDSRTRRIYIKQEESKSIKCSECGNMKTTLHKHRDNTTEIMNEINPYLSQLESLTKETNTFQDSIKEYNDELVELGFKNELTKAGLNKLNTMKLDLEILRDVLQDFRGALVQNTISSLESRTNEILYKHFDGEIKVTFNIEEADKLEVSILKDGNTCSYTQLSKGQRCMLKLAFGVSVMSAVQNHHGIKINQVFLDEALDGLDDTNKLKAVHMLETLALDYDSIYLVEHSETIKAHIDNSYRVELVNGESQIEKA